MPMNFGPRAVFAVIWAAWVASWIVASWWSARTQTRAARSTELLYHVLIGSGAVLMTPWAARRLGAAPLWNPSAGGAYLLAAAVLAGLVFTWWARIQLGRLWSSAITRKENHRIVDSGPYALVRHPIYTGLIAAILASAVAEATLTALIGAALVVLGLWVKARAEERFLTGELGVDAYETYRRRVPMLVPRLWRRQR
jgi:protein-S-isoprenylcysteine O-methyltransferase Ste14